MLVASRAGIPLPAARYTSYDAAPAEAGQVSLADVCEGSTAALAGNVLTTQAASTGAAAVVNVVVLDAAQPTAGPLAFFGTTYQLYEVEPDKLTAVYALVVTLAVAVAGADPLVGHTNTS